MCQSAKTSIIAWVVAAIIAIIIISSGKPTGKWNGFFILTFILVQLLEFFIWHERSKLGLTTSASDALKEGSNSSRNGPSGETATRLILIALWLQPLVQTFMAYKYGNPEYKQPLLIITMAFFVMFIWSIVQASDQSEDFSSQPVVGCGETCDPDKPCPSGHLEWKRSKSSGFLGPSPASALYLFGLFFGLFFMQPGIFGLMLTILGGILACYSAKHTHAGESSSMWCMYAIFYAFLALVISFSRRSPKVTIRL